MEESDSNIEPESQNSPTIENKDVPESDLPTPEESVTPLNSDPLVPDDQTASNPEEEKENIEKSTVDMDEISSNEEPKEQLERAQMIIDKLKSALGSSKVSLQTVAQELVRKNRERMVRIDY